MKILYITTVPETFFFFFTPVLERLKQEKGEVVPAASGGTWITGADVENKYGVPGDTGVAAVAAVFLYSCK